MSRRPGVSAARATDRRRNGVQDDCRHIGDDQPDQQAVEQSARRLLSRILEDVVRSAPQLAHFQLLRPDAARRSPAERMTIGA